MGDTVEGAADAARVRPEMAPWTQYVLPMAAFFLLTALESLAPSVYPCLYLGKVAIVTGCLAWCRRSISEIRWNAHLVLPALLVGGLVFGEWVFLGPLTHYPRLSILGTRSSYDPFTSIHSDGLRAMFLIARFYGLVLLVPVVEELFWRSFLLRYFTDPERYYRLRIGEFSWTAFGLVAMAFGLSHPEWLEGIVCGIAYGLLLWRTRSLFACVIAHSVTNLLLGIYILTNHAWSLW